MDGKKALFNTFYRAPQSLESLSKLFQGFHPKLFGDYIILLLLTQMDQAFYYAGWLSGEYSFWFSLFLNIPVHHQCAGHCTFALPYLYLLRCNLNNSENYTRLISTSRLTFGHRKFRPSIYKAKENATYKPTTGPNYLRYSLWFINSLCMVHFHHQ